MDSLIKSKQRQFFGVSLPATLEKWLDLFGDEFGYLHLVTPEKPLTGEAGSYDRVDELRRRATLGQPIFSYIDIEAGVTDPDFATYVSDVAWTTISGNNRKGQEKSVCGRYQYRSWGIWDDAKPIACFVGMYPNEADERACSKLATFCGFGGYQLVNLLSSLGESEDDIGDWNDRIIRVAVVTSSVVICGWGVSAQNWRVNAVVSGIKNSKNGIQLECFGADGQHPIAFRKAIKLGMIERKILPKQLKAEDACV